MEALTLSNNRYSLISRGKHKSEQTGYKIVQMSEKNSAGKEIKVTVDNFC